MKLIQCEVCGDNGIVDLSEEEFAKIKPYLDAGLNKYPCGGEIETMKPCVDCCGLVDEN